MVITMSEEAPSLTLMVKSVARHLSNPYKTGVYISIPDLVLVARSLDLPIVVRDTREWMIEELMKIAIDYGKLKELVDSLEMLIRGKRRDLEKLLEQYPLAKPLYEEYFDNINKTLEKLEELKKIYVKYYKVHGY